MQPAETESPSPSPDDRRADGDRRSHERRLFPPRPEGRRTGGGRRDGDREDS